MVIQARGVRETSGGLVGGLGGGNLGDMNNTKRFVKCPSRRRAEAVAARVGEVWAAARAAGGTGAGAGVSGGGF